MAEYFFYISLFLLIYTYFGYPVVLFILSLFLKQEIKRGNIQPTVAVIIPVHNEERSIVPKIENCLAFDYPHDKIKILIVSDNSTDRTEEIVKRFKDKKIQYLSLPFRGGKVAAQNYAVRFCDTEIIIFTDVAISTDTNSVKLIVENFYDKKVGVVSCKDVVLGSKKKSQGEGSYIRYDMLVRDFTSQIGSIMGVTGGFYAMRREIAEGGWNPAFPPDFYVAIRCINRGLRVIEDGRVKAYYKTASKEWDELPRKVRTMNRGMNALFSISNRNLLNPFKYGMVSFELISHKLFRWLTPFFLIALFWSNLAIPVGSVFTEYIFLSQTVLYLLALITFLGSKWTEKIALLKFPRYFAIANVAILKAWFEFIIGRRYVMWQPTKR